MTEEIPVSMICFNEARIKRMTIDRALSSDELKNHRIRLSADFLKQYDPAKHDIEIIIKDKQGGN